MATVLSRKSGGSGGGGGAPSGPAGGDLSGTYPNPTLAAGVVGMVGVERKVAPSGGSASFDFQNIPQDGWDLLLVLMIRSEVAAANEVLHMRFNNDSGGNYDWIWLAAQASATNVNNPVGQTSFTIGEATGASVASRTARVEIIIPAYATTDFFKGYTAASGYSIGANANDQGTRNTYGIWRNTAALTRVTVFCATADIAEGSVASLYKLGG